MLAIAGPATLKQQLVAHDADRFSSKYASSRVLTLALEQAEATTRLCEHAIDQVIGVRFGRRHLQDVSPSAHCGSALP
jgi:hypothetical protein